MSIQRKDTLINFKNVCFGYTSDKQIINNVSFDLFNNEIVCVIGANASGKSTLAKMIVGLYKPTSGLIYFKDKMIDKTNFTLLKNNCGIIFENPDSQLIGFSAEDDIAFTLENKQIESNKIKETIIKLSNIVGINDILTLDTSLLSGGQKQKVAIASILVSDPKVIIFDESTSMLDAADKHSLINLMNKLKTVYKKTIIWITHDMDETIFADRIMVLNQGKIVYFDKPEKVFANNLEKLGLSNPFVLELSKKIKGIKPTINLETLIKEIKHVK